jgi:hypothetical protein
MSLGDAFFACKAGPTGTLAFTTSSTAAHRMLTEIPGPTLIQLFSDQDVYVRQGASNMDAADSNDFLLLANTYWTLVIEAERENYLRVIGASASGTLRMTNISNLRLTPRSA